MNNDKALTIEHAPNCYELGHVVYQRISPYSTSTIALKCVEIDGERAWQYLGVRL